MEQLFIYELVDALTVARDAVLEQEVRITPASRALGALASELHAASQGASPSGELLALLGSVSKRLSSILDRENDKPISDRLFSIYRHRTTFSGTPIDHNRIIRAARMLQRDANVRHVLTAANVLVASRVGSAPSNSRLADLLILNNVAPDQKLSPFYFEVANGKISLAGEQGPRSSGSSHASKEQILEWGHALLDSLPATNCDPRLPKCVKEVMAEVETGGNPIRLGLSNMRLGIFAASMTDEFSSGNSAQLLSFHTAVSMYAAQFDEWSSFSLNATAIEIPDSVIRDVMAAAEEVANELRDPLLAQSDVPLSIIFLREMLNDPRMTSKRAAFALIRTLENLVSAIVHYGLDLARSTAHKSADRLSDSLSKDITRILSVALLTTTGLAAATAFTGSAWIIQAGEAISRILGIS